MSSIETISVGVSYAGILSLSVAWSISYNVSDFGFCSTKLSYLGTVSINSPLLSDNVSAPFGSSPIGFSPLETLERDVSTFGNIPVPPQLREFSLSQV